MSERAVSPAVVIYDNYPGNDGHRGEYYALMARLIGSTRTSSLWRALWARQPVLDGAIEASVGSYILLCVVRAAMGRRTAGILFRPLPLLEGGLLRLRVKRMLLGLVKRLPGVATLTILPFELEPGFARFASGWIYDPQYWDLHYPDAVDADRPIGAFAQEIRAAAAKRRVVVAVGRQDEAKGFDMFSQLFAARADLRERWLFAFGGRVVDRLVAPCLDPFVAAGGQAKSEYISHDELLDLYAAADAVWCCYALDYDEASGVFGRAIQLGLPVIVRKGSLLERTCRAEGLAYVAYDGEVASFDGVAVPAPTDPVLAARRARQWGEESVTKLRGFLGLA